LLNEKTKNSLSDKRGSIVKSIGKLASSIMSDEANSAASASSASMVMLQMQLQQQQQQQMQQAFMQSQMEFQMRRIEEIRVRLNQFISLCLIFRSKYSLLTILV
jgi:hypothetical protein